MIMKTQPPAEAVVWLLDLDSACLEAVRQHLQGRLHSLRIEAFEEPEAVAKAVQRLTPDATPWFTNTDHVGLVKVAGKPSVRQLFRRQSPLTMFSLYSFSAYQEPGLVPRLLEEKEVDAAFMKDRDIDQLGRTIEAWQQRWRGPVPTQIRRQMPVGGGGAGVRLAEGVVLDLGDIHREIVKGGALGEELEKAWEFISIEANAR